MADFVDIEVPAKVHTCVQYPGYVANLPRVMCTFGGESAVERAHNDPNSLLELRFRPNSTAAHPIRAVREHANGILLKIVRKKKPADDAMDTDEPPFVSVEAIGTVREEFKFTGMADFQYSPSMPARHVEQQNTAATANGDMMGTEFFSADVPYDLAPPIFSREVTPHDYAFQSNALTSARVEEESGIYISFTDRKHVAHAVAYPSALPAMPALPPQSEGPKDSFGELLQQLRKLFDTRPVWSRNAVLAQTPGVPFHRLKRALSQVAYVFSNGPFRTLHVRHGYDPRVQPDSKIYQILDFRLSQKFFSSFKQIASRLPSRPAVPSRFLPKGARPPPEEVKKSDLSYKYTRGTLPSTQHVLYQLCDLHEQELQEIISSSETNDKCDERYGWLPAEVPSHLRAVIKRQLREKFREQLQATAGPSLPPGEGMQGAGAAVASGAADFASELMGLSDDED